MAAVGKKQGKSGASGNAGKRGQKAKISKTERALKKINRLKRERARLIQVGTLWDDAVAIAAFRGNIGAVQCILRIALKDSSIVITRVSTHYHVSNLGGRELILDIRADGSDGTIYNIEIQRWRVGSELERPRFHDALLTKDALAPGEPFTELADVRVVFLIEKDFLGKGWAGYATPDFLVRLDENATEIPNETMPANNGAKTIYLNGAFYKQGKGGSITDLTHDFSCATPEDMRIPALRKALMRAKLTKKGQKILYNWLEERDDEELAEEHEAGREEGRIEGRVEGRIEGRVEGRIEGREEGLVEKGIKVATKAIRRNMGRELTRELTEMADKELDEIGNMVKAGLSDEEIVLQMLQMTPAY